MFSREKPQITEVGTRLSKGVGRTPCSGQVGCPRGSLPERMKWKVGWGCFPTGTSDKHHLSSVIKASVNHGKSYWQFAPCDIMKLALYLCGPPSHDPLRQSDHEKGVRLIPVEGRRTKSSNSHTVRNFLKWLAGLLKAVKIIKNRGSLRNRLSHRHLRRQDNVTK